MVIYPLGVIGPWEVVIIALVIVLLFGGKKIPELMKGVGKGVKSFKQGYSEVENEIKDIKNDVEKPETPKSIETKGEVKKED